MRVSRVFDRRTYYGGHVVFRQGDRSFNAYLIENGEVEIVRETPTGEVILATLGPGNLFGEMGLLDGKPRSATARVPTMAVLNVVNEATIERLKSQIDKKVWALIEVLMHRLRQANRRLDQLSVMHHPHECQDAAAAAKETPPV